MSIEWVDKTLSAAVKGLKRFTIFMDNLTAQESDEFKEAVSKIMGVNWYGPPNATDLWQTVDAGVAQLLKVLIRLEQELWLEDDANANRWYGHTDEKQGFTASDRRVLITNWAGEAWKKLTSAKYESLLRQCWERTGCLITADGSEDEKIKPEGLPNYQVPPPLDFVEPLTTAPVSNTVSGEADTNEEIDDHEEEEEPTDEGVIALDREEDRDFSDELVSMKVNVLYEYGWTTGEVEYYNKALQEYKVMFCDGSSDYIPADDIGGEDVQVIVG